MEKGIVPEDKRKSVLDEQALARLLEAAFIVQEHNRELGAAETAKKSDSTNKLNRAQGEDRAAATRPEAAKSAQSQIEKGASRDNNTLALAQIVETQQQIQGRHLELDEAMSLVAERVLGIVGAAGAAIGLLDNNQLKYRAVAGLKTLPKGKAVAIESTLCLPCLKTGRVLRWADANQKAAIDAEECQRRGIASLMAVPIFRNGQVAGGMELYYSVNNAFTDQDVHTCQLMAGLVTEALAREEEQEWKRSLASERAAMLEALEKLQPNLAALLNTSPAKDTAVKPMKNTVVKAPAGGPAGRQACRKCGHEIVGEEQFCGQCGSPRSRDYEPPNMQSKLASLWQLQQAREREDSSPAANGNGKIGKQGENPEQELPETLAQSLEEQMPELFQEPSAGFDAPVGDKHEPLKLPAQFVSNEYPPEDSDGFPDEFEAESSPAESDKAEERTPKPVALAKIESTADWSSAASARNFIEQMVATKPSSALVNFWNTRRGDIYLAVAMILVACVVRWGLWSNHAVSATSAPNVATRHKSPQDDLPLFDRMLISLGLADPPDMPEDKGNPNAQVWVDTHTALYYCSGADLYGKTPKGKFATQREAQLDQFQPAYRKACN